MQRPGLSVVIPAYNEEDGIAEIVDRVIAVKPAMTSAGFDLDLFVVDDGSHDRTAEIVSARAQAVNTQAETILYLVEHPRNKGYGAALKTGFQAASALHHAPSDGSKNCEDGSTNPERLIGFLDADGTYPPEFFPQLCLAASQGADLVVGSRRSGASSEMPFVRRVGNLIWASLVSLLSGQRVMDPASGMRVFNASTLEKLYPLPDGLNFTPVMSMRAVHEGVKLLELPIPYKERLGRSKLNIVRDGLRFLQTIIWTALNYNPVRILGGIGAVMAGLGVIIGLVLIGMRLAGVTQLGPGGVAATFTAVVLALGGINLFALGVTFNYLVALFHKRPIRQGLFGKPLLKTPLETHFWWMGLLCLVGGLAIGLTSFFLGLGGWSIERLWLYLLAGSMTTLLGFQLFTFWVIVQVLNELSQREIQIQSDLEAK
ncbi:MAG: glycosyltransferase family 2 protein [Anaerolineales bacterium]|nr:glycosyltransferase family 2 protein [Anaerolineales bacterium]